MAHTDKDAPYWVRLNDYTASTTVSHCCGAQYRFAGRPVYGRTRPVHDEDGNPVYEEVKVYDRGVARPQYGWYTGEDKRSVWEVTRPDGSIEYHGYGSHYLIAGDGVLAGNITRKRRVPAYSIALRVKTERRIIGYYPTECDADEPERPRSATTPKLCDRRFADGNFWGYARNRPMTEEKRIYQASQRQKERTALKNAAKAYDPDDEDWWGDELEKANTRQQRHVGWWD